MKTFAIVLACYNRIQGLKRLLDSLNRSDYDGRKDISLIFSIDNSGKNYIEEFAKKYDWKFGEKRIRTFPERQGLKKHILQCGDFTKEYDIVVVLEDDIIVSECFYHYAYQAAEYYWDDDNVAGISLYNFQKNWLNWLFRFEPLKTEFDTYFLKIAQSWGQVWTKNKWMKFIEWYHCNEVFTYSDYVPKVLYSWTNSSWLKYHDRYCIETNRYFVYPYYSLSTNNCDAGTHSDKTYNDYQVSLQFKKKEYSFPVFDNNSIIYDEYMNREGLEKYLGVDNLTVDFFGTKNRKLWKRYLLTAIRYHNVKPLKSFSLSLVPIEASIIYNLPGVGIYLYEVADIKEKRGSNYDLMKYELRSSEGEKLLKFSLALTIKRIFEKISRLYKKF